MKFSDEVQPICLPSYSAFKTCWDFKVKIWEKFEFFNPKIEICFQKHNSSKTTQKRPKNDPKRPKTTQKTKKTRPDKKNENSQTRCTTFASTRPTKARSPCPVTVQKYTAQIPKPLIYK